MSFWTIRMHALRRSMRIIARRPGAWLLAVGLSAVALMLPLLAATVAVGAQPLVAAAPIAPELSVFVSPAAGAQQLKALQARLEAVARPAEVRHIPREAALAQLAERSGLGALLRELETNPLPDVFVVALPAGTAPATVETVATEVRKLPLVDSVQFDAAWYGKLLAIGRVALIGGAVIGVGLLMLALTVTIGAVLLLAKAPKEEAQVLRMVGADDAYIARPYAYVGALTLAPATALAIAAVAGALRAINMALAELARLHGGQGFSIPMLPGLFLTGLVIAGSMIGWLLGSLGARAAPPPPT